MINSTINSGHGMTPYTTLFGRSAPTLLDHARLESLDPQPMSDIMEGILAGQTIAHDIALETYVKNCKILKETYDKRIKHSPLTAGDVVVYHRPVVQDTSRPRKLQTTMWGPAIVLKVYENGVADIKHLHLPQNKGLKKVNISQLKRSMHYQLNDRAEILRQNGVHYEPILQTPNQPTMVKRM